MVDGLTPLTYKRLLTWHKEHPDAYLVTDIKVRNLDGLAELAKQFDQRRIVPQIYQMEEYQPAKELGYDKVILTLYRLTKPDAEVLAFARNHPLLAVTMPKDFALKSSLPRDLAKARIPVCLHTVNAKDEQGYRSIRSPCLYTDDLVP
jgi:hypothetical protein